jgi:hypothetical protein
MRKKRSQARQWKASTMQFADDAITYLTAMCRQAESGRDPGLADVKAALNRLHKLQSKLRNDPRKQRQWRTLMEAVAYLAKVANDLYFT